MLTVRLYLVLKWVGWHLVRPIRIKDRWGFNLGEDLYDWAGMQVFMYIRRLEKAAHLQPVQLARGPRPQSWITTPGASTSTTGTGATVTWTVSRG